MDHPSSGTILTFYSYKGGTGRSMTLVNYACWLSRRSAGSTRVLLIDWDLEAPGLQRFFPESEAREGADRGGLINYFEAIRTGLDGDPTLYERIASDGGSTVLRSAFPFDTYLMRDVVPGVDLLRAGRLDADYARVVSAFNWIQFHDKYRQVFQALREMIASDYRYCLIDSRTGFNDVSGVCTMLMAEKLVLVFTPNRQSLSGVLDLAARAVNYRRTADDFRPLAIFPLPSRIENAELDLKQQWRKRYQEEFQATLTRIYELDSCDLNAYFDDVVVPHVSYYSYGEEIAVLRESSSDALSLSRAYETFFRRLEEMEFAWDHRTGQPATSLSPPHAPTERAPAAIFVSYAHIDNLQVTEGARGWVETFHRMLQIRLQQLTGRDDVQVWRDPKLAGNDYLDDTFFETIRKAAIFISIASPAYLRSAWCRRELETFLAQPDAGQASTATRVFKVLKAPVPLDEQPPALRDRLGYDFFEIDGSSGRIRELNSDQDRNYLFRLDDLAHDIAAAISAGPMELLEEPRKAVYVAESSSDLKTERENIRRALEQGGHRVLPEAALPLEPGRLRAAIQEQLAACGSSVHLLGRHYGLVAEGETRGIPELQLELARDRAAADPSFTRVVWAPTNLEPADDRQRELLARLYDLVRSPLEELKHRLLSVSGPKAARSAAASDARPFIYLIFDRRDTDAAGGVADYLFGRGFEVVMPIWEGEEGEIRAYHEDSLAMCDGVILYFGMSSELWLRRCIRELAKAKAIRTKPLVAAVLLGPPESDAKRRFRTHEMQVIDAMTTPFMDVLQPLVDGVRSE